MPWAPRVINLKTKGLSRVVIELYSRDLVVSLPEYRNIYSSLKHYSQKFNSRDAFGKLLPQDESIQSPISRDGLSGLLSKRIVKVLDKQVEYVQEFYRIDFTKMTAFIVLDSNEEEYSQCITGLDLVLKSFRLESGG